MLALTAADIAAAAGGRVIQGDAARAIGPIVIDSRSLAAGDFFIAIRGERFDGHDFVADALDRGAIGVLVDRAVAARQAGGGLPVVIETADTTAGPR